MSAQLDRMGMFLGWCRVCGARELVNGGKVAQHNPGDMWCPGGGEAPSAVEVKWDRIPEGTEQVYAKGYADGHNGGRKCGCTIHGDREQPCENPADICYRCRWECWGDTMTVPPTAPAPDVRCAAVEGCPCGATTPDEHDTRDAE